MWEQNIFFSPHEISAIRKWHTGYSERALSKGDTIGFLWRVVIRLWATRNAANNGDDQRELWPSETAEWEIIGDIFLGGHMTVTGSSPHPHGVQRPFCLAPRVSLLPSSTLPSAKRWGMLKTLAAVVCVCVCVCCSVEAAYLRDGFPAKEQGSWLHQDVCCSWKEGLRTLKHGNTFLPFANTTGSYLWKEPCFNMWKNTQQSLRGKSQEDFFLNLTGTGGGGFRG